MSMRGVWIVAAGALVMIGPGVDAGRAQPTAPTLPEFAVLGIASVRILPKSRVVSGAVGCVGGTVRVGRMARIGMGAGPTIRLAAGSDTGALFCHSVSGLPPLPSCNASRR